VVFGLVHVVEVQLGDPVRFARLAVGSGRFARLAGVLLLQLRVVKVVGVVELAVKAGQLVGFVG